jgi:predicted DNA-binding transcriptional regulator AlpA
MGPCGRRRAVRRSPSEESSCLTIDPHAPDERLVPAKEFTARLGVSRRTLGERLRDGSVPPPVRLRGRLYWLRSAVERFFAGLGAAGEA